MKDFSPVSDDSFLTGDELRDRKYVQLLLEAIGEVSSTLSLDRLLINIVDKSIELTRAERGILLLKNEEKIKIRVARDARKADLIRPIQYSTTVALQVAQTGKPLRKMVSSDSEAADLARSVFDLKLRAVMCAPLMVKDQLIGVIYVDSRAAEREFSKTDLSFFNALSRQLAIAIENARLVADSLEKAKLEQELHIASEIQKGLLPQEPPNFPAAELFGWYEACEGTTGDSYDFYPLDENRVALVLSDVSGHGVGPALLAATARAALRAYLKSSTHIGRVIELLGSDLSRDLKPGSFMTLFLAEYQAKEHKLIYFNAGHPSPYLIRSNGTVSELDGFEPAFGFREDGPVQALETKLEKGDTLFVFSDGVPEARSPQGELYGNERLIKTLTRLSKKSVQEIVEGVVQDVLQFTGQKKQDDMTLLALRAI